MLFDENERGIGEYEAMLNNKERLEIVGKCMERVRKKHKLKQKQIAEFLEIPQQTYGGYETGRHAPSIETLVRLSFIYNESIDNIVGKWEKTNPESENYRKIEKELEIEELEREIKEIYERLAQLEKEMNRP